MTQRRQTREEINLSQAAAASRAGVSLATWRRWEEDPEAVSANTQGKCERVLETKSARGRAREDWEIQAEQLWNDHPLLTPRQAVHLGVQLDMWQSQIECAAVGEPLYNIGPFVSLDPRVLIHVNENRTWLYLACQRINALSDEIHEGVLPFDRDGCFFDEVLMACLQDWAEETWPDEDLEWMDGIPAQEDDDDWGAVADAFDGAAHWEDWKMPTELGSRFLPMLLAVRHPFTWFDRERPADAAAARTRFEG